MRTRIFECAQFFPLWAGAEIALAGRRVSHILGTVRRSSPVCVVYRYPSGFWERSSLAIWQSRKRFRWQKNLNDTNAVAIALAWAAILGQSERNPTEVNRLASD
jgi:hypothetical protein